MQISETQQPFSCRHSRRNVICASAGFMQFVASAVCFTEHCNNISVNTLLKCCCGCCYLWPVAAVTQGTCIRITAVHNALMYHVFCSIVCMDARKCSHDGVSTSPTSCRLSSGAVLKPAYQQNSSSIYIKDPNVMLSMLATSESMLAHVQRPGHFGTALGPDQEQPC